MYEETAGKICSFTCKQPPWLCVCVCMCDERPEAISACTAEQSFGSRSECESQKTDRSAAGEDTMTMKPHLDTFLIVHFTQREKHKGRQREERGAQ